MSVRERDGSDKDSPWNSLEVAKLLVSTSITVAIFAIGIVLQRQQSELSFERSRAEQARAVSTLRETKLLDKRAELWDQLGPVLAEIGIIMNDPPISDAEKIRVEALERKSNELVITYQLYFSRDFLNAIEWHDDIVEFRLRRGEAPDKRDLRGAYKAVQRAVAKDMNLTPDQRVLDLET